MSKGTTLITCEGCEDVETGIVTNEELMILPDGWHWELVGEYYAPFCTDCDGDQL